MTKQTFTSFNSNFNSNFKLSKLGHPVGALLLMSSLLVGCIAPTPTEPLPSPAATQPVTAPATAASITETETPVETPDDTPTKTVVEAPTPASEPAPTGEGEPADGQTPIAESGNAIVESLDIRILESFPVQIHAVVTGYLPDGCTTIDETEVVQEATTFRIRMTTDRPQGAMCTQALVPFEQVVPLDVTELPAGSYDVRINELVTSFELP